MNFADLRERYDRQGWLVLPDVIAAERTSAVVRALETAWPGAPADKWTNAWRTHPAVAGLAADPMVLEALEHLYGRRPIPFQTLNLWTGSEQRFHADSVHFDSVPPGWMCGVWVALEDVGDDQGPLQLVDGSHRLAELRPEAVVTDPDAFEYRIYEDEVAQVVHGRPVTRFLARRGQVLIWQSDLVHGGAVVSRSGATRWSQVTHYVFEGATYITPMRSDMAGGRYWVRDPLVDISTGRRVTHVLDGSAVVMEHLGRGRTRLWSRGDVGPGVVARVRSAARGVARELRHAVGTARDARAGRRARRRHDGR